MKKMLFLLLGIAIFMLTACDTKKDQTSSSANLVTAGNQVTAAGVTMKWNVIGNDLAITLTAQTSGWIAVGFNPTIGMQNANIIISYVNNNTVFTRDDYGSGPTSHNADTINNIMSATGTETNGFTEIGFKIPLNSGDSQDQNLVVGNTYTIILAYGNGDDFTSAHTNRATVNIKIQ